MSPLLKTRIFVIVCILSVLGCSTGERPTDAGGGEAQLSEPPRPRTRVPSDTARMPTLVRRQTLYVPAYAHIFFQDERRTINLATTLSIHNTDPDHAIRLTAVEYYDSEGQLVRRNLEKPRTLEAFASTWYVIEESDLSGGVGANFIVEWESDTPVSPPVVETVMISTVQQQGISFTSRARVLEQE